MPDNKAQSILEFTFGMIVAMLLIFALVQAMRWVMMDLAERRYTHDKMFMTEGLVDAGTQLKPKFKTPTPIDAVLNK